jgi:hypothetical protein
VVKAGLAAIQANGRGERERSAFASHGATKTENVVRFFFEAAGEHIDTDAVARQAADYLAGRPRPLREHVIVDLSVPSGVPLFDGWELSPVPSKREPLWALNTCALDHTRGGAAGLHGEGFGELWRLKPVQALDSTPPGAHDLIWPLIALNLLGPTPVRAFTAYLTEPGRRLMELRDGRRTYVPKEITAWHRDPLSVARPNGGGWAFRYNSLRVIDARTASGIGRYAAEFGAALSALKEADRRAFARAAEHHLYLAYHHGGHQGELNGSYVAFRRTVATEILLAGSDKDHGSIARKVSQRAAILIGEDDDDRLAVHASIRAAYAARSAFAHGSQGTKTVDDANLAKVVRLIARRWLALAGSHPGPHMATLLDNALLSVTVRDSVLRTIEEHERRAGISGDTRLESGEP